MDERALSYLNIQFTRSHTGRVLNRIPDPAEMTKPSLFLAQEKLLYVSIFEYVATLSHGDRQPLQGTPSVIHLCSHHLEAAATMAGHQPYSGEVLPG